MNRVFLDTNILLDVFLEREPFCGPAQILWSMAEKKAIRAAISAISVNNIFFIVERLSSGEKAYRAVRALADSFTIMEVGSQTIRRALDARYPDFEDALQYYSAMKFRAQVLVSRDPAGFMEKKIPVMDATQYLALTQATTLKDSS